MLNVLTWMADGHDTLTGTAETNPERLLRAYFVARGLASKLMCRTMFTVASVAPRVTPTTKPSTPGLADSTRAMTEAYDVRALVDPFRWFGPRRPCTHTLWLKYIEEHDEAISTCGAEADVCYKPGERLPPPVGRPRLNLSKGKLVLHLKPWQQQMGLRYFCVVRRPAHGPDSGSSSSSSSGGSDSLAVWFLARVGFPSGSTSVSGSYSTAILSTGGHGPTVIARDSSVSHNLVLKRVGSAYHAFGGQDWRPRTLRDQRDGIRHYAIDGGAEAKSFEALLSGAWGQLPHDNRSLLFDGTHGGCHDRRADDGVCEFDGKVGAVFMPPTDGSAMGTWHLFLRQNHKARGGRYVAVTTSKRGARGPFGPLVQLKIEGYTAGGGNIYFAAVDNHPLDPEMMIGLFPVNEGAVHGEARSSSSCGNCDGAAYIAISLSCDGVHWTPLHPLIHSHGREGRTDDQPVDGVVLSADGSRLFFWVNMAVESIAPEWASTGRIAEYSIPVGGPAGLGAFTESTKAGLRGCSRRSQQNTTPAVHLGYDLSSLVSIIFLASAMVVLVAPMMRR